MSNEMIQTPAILLDKGKLADNTRKLVLMLQEIQPDDELEIIKNHGKQGWFVFSPTKIKPDEIEVPDYKPIFAKDKTPGQRLRSSLYVYWEQQFQNTHKDFDSFYKNYMEKIIIQIKEKLN